MDVESKIRIPIILHRGYRSNVGLFHISITKASYDKLKMTLGIASDEDISGNIVETKFTLTDEFYFKLTKLGQFKRA